MVKFWRLMHPDGTESIMNYNPEKEFNGIINNIEDIIDRINKNEKSRLRYLRNPKHKKKSKESVNKSMVERKAQRRILKRILNKFVSQEATKWILN